MLRHAHQLRACPAVLEARIEQLRHSPEALEVLRLQQRLLELQQQEVAQLEQQVRGWGGCACSCCDGHCVNACTCICMRMRMCVYVCACAYMSTYERRCPAH